MSNDNPSAKKNKGWLRKLLPMPKHSKKRYYATKIEKTPSNEPEEVKIPVPWGHIAGKWWGPKDVRPILCIHGWQDNCGTFDALVPLLPKQIGFLAIDLPGHGLSSRLPKGTFYNNIDFVIIIQLICKKYNWEQVSILGHSFGSVLGFIYGGVFPNNMDMLISIDSLRPDTRPRDEQLRVLQSDIDNFIISDERNSKMSEPPAYTYEELIKRVHEGSRKSVSLEAAHYMIRRGIAKSELHPEKYYFTRDARLLSSIPTLLTLETHLELAKAMKFPHCLIKATDTPFGQKAEHPKLYDFLEKENPKFEIHTIEGTHHVHLNNPEPVVRVISEFINKYRPLEMETGNMRSKL